jgi:hypothetical protein
VTYALAAGYMALACALSWCAWCALDVGRRWIAYREHTVTEAAALAELRERDDIHDRAISNLAKTFAAELATERDKIAKLEAQRAAHVMGSKSTRNTVDWRQQG